MVGVVISVIGPPLLNAITVVIVKAAADAATIIVLFIHELFNCFIGWFLPDSIFYSLLALFPRCATILLITSIML